MSLPAHLIHRSWPTTLRTVVVSLLALCCALTSRAQSTGGPRLQSISGLGSVDVGERVLLAVIFFGNPPATALRYQWQKNGEPLAGATTSSYLIAAATAADAGTYAITVSSDGGPSTLSGALTVNPPAAIQFSSVIVNPARSVQVGSALTFLVNAVGTFPRTYQWQKDGTNIPGATNLTLNIYPVVLSDAGNYTLIGRNSLGTTTTLPVTITVSPATPIMFAPNSPADATFIQGQGGQLELTLSQGSHPMTYQWRKNGVPIPGAVSAYLPLGAITFADAGRYSVTATNGAGSATSREALVSVVPATPIVISTHPAAQSVFEGQEARFSFNFNAGTQPISYQWRKNGAAISGQTSSVLAIRAVVASDAGDYSVVLTNPAGSVTSNAATLTIRPASPPTILRQPVDVTATYFDQFGLSAEVAATPPLTYQWKKNGVLVSTNGPSLSYTSVTQELHGGIYILEVSNVAGTVSTVPVTVTVRPPMAPVITRQPESITVALGMEASFMVQYATTGTGYVTLQWLRNGQPIGSPATGGESGFANKTENYNIRAVQPSDAGTYSARLTSSTGTVTSSVATLTIRDGPPSTQDFSGIYLAPLRGFTISGDVALYVRPDRTAVLLSQVNGMPLYSATAFALDTDGSFRVEANSYPLSFGSKRIIIGVVSADGTMSGSIFGTGDSFSGSKVVGGSSIAGFYHARSPTGGADDTLAIVAGDRRCVVLTQNSQMTVAVAGTLDASGALSATNPNGITLTVSLSADVGELTATGSSSRTGAATFLGVREGMVRAARLANISSRGRAGVGGEAMIAGFVISGPGPRTILVRAIGPALDEFGVKGALADPKLSLFRGSAPVMESDDWGTQLNASSITATAVRVGAFALSPSGKDAVLLATLDAGNYTAQVSAKNGVAGVSLVEVYDADDDMGASAPRLLNIATRGWVGAGDDALIAGIVVAGNAPKSLLIRAIGPGLASLGVTGTLADPTLTLQAGNRNVADNDNWSTLDGTNSIITVLTATAKVGAFSLGAASLDAALVARLNPGNYTARVSGKGGATGVALIEVYEFEP